MGSVNEILELAHSQLGNGGARYWNWYTDNVRPSQGYYVNGDITPYCAEYMSWLLAETDTPCIYFPDPYAFDARDIPESDRIRRYDLQAGDIVSFDWDDDETGDHVGIVTELRSWGIITNEGNVDGGYVRERTRSWSEILFGIRPLYDIDPHDKLIVDGVFGELTVECLQRCLQYHGYYTDCIVDGYFGYYTICALQEYLTDKDYYDGGIDGDFGYYSTCALQLYLRYLGYYTDYYIIDGWWGEETTKALQRSLNDNRF